TGTSLSQSPTSNTTYYASCKNGSCESSRVATSQVTVTTQPNSPTSVNVNNTTICSGTAVSLTATCSTGTLTWYNQSSGGTAIGTGTSLSQSPTVNTTYYASCKNGSCESSRVATSQVTVTTQPNSPTSVNVDNTTICSGTAVSLTATCSTGTLTWYNQSSVGTAIGTGTSLSQSPTVNTTYYASCKNGSCESSRVATSQVTVTTQPNSPTSVNVDNATICSGSSVSLTASCSSGTLTWYNQSSGGTAIGTGTSLSQSPTANTTYYASCKNGSCESSRVATSQVTVTTQPNSPTSVNVDNTTICSGSSVSLNATCSTGTLTWYNQSSGGTAIGTGTSLSQSPTSNTTYYASCKNGSCESSRVATSQVTVTTQPNSPTSINVDNTTICSGSSVSLTASCSSGTLTWYNQSSGGTAIGTGTSLSQSPTVNTTYYASCKNGSCESSRVATSQVTVTTQPNSPTSVNVDNTTICSGSSVSLTASCSSGTLTWYNQSSGGTAIGTGTSLSQSPTVNTTYYASCKNGSCESSRVATSQVTVTTQPNSPTSVNVDNTTICSGSSVSLTASCSSGTLTWYNQSSGGTAIGTGTSLSQSPTVNTTYYASCKNGSCESSRVATSQVTVTTQPNSPTSVNVDNATICSGTAVSLTATCSTGTLTWYNQSSGGTAIGTGTSLSQSPTVNTTYYASCKNGSCESSRVATSQVTVTTLPSAPTINAPSTLVVCSPNTLTLTASGCEGTVMWSNSSTGTSLTLSAVGTYTISATCTLNGCVSNVSTPVSGLEILSPVTPQASNTGPYKIGQTIQLNALGGTSYQWEGPNGFTSNTASPIIDNALPINAGTYTVTVSNGICSATATTSVMVDGIDPCTQVVAYQYVKAGNPYQPMFTLTNGMVIQQIPEQVSIMAVPVCPTIQVGSVDMTIVGPEINWTILQNVEPYAIFDNLAQSFNGRNFIPGTYTMTVTGYLEDNRVGGIVYGPVVTTFTVVGSMATISAPIVPNNALCAGSTIDVSFTTTGNFDLSNTFNIQLSDVNGSFTNPVIIGTTNSAGTVSCQIPQNLSDTGQYLIRVASSNQVVAGNPTMSFLTITAAARSLTNEISTGTVTEKASQQISAENKITSPASVTYQAGKSIILNPGFEAKEGSVFKAQIQGCAN
ncbi:Ig-like domain-containing protein, partial [Emticicia sp. 17c]|uniref:Ig-like domain-containing protein n=1 Tax=Emticicia sp. 17c TaxID=3127704 RepID=UPI00301BC6A4